MGLLDNWLPVLSSLKEAEDIHISVIFPTQSIIGGLINNTFLRVQTNELCDDFFLKDNEIIWKYSNNLEELCLRKKSALLMFQDKIIRKLKLIKIIKIIISNIELLFFNRGFKKSIFDDTQLVLCDVSEIKKEYNVMIFSKFNSLPKFSISHALSLPPHEEGEQTHKDGFIEDVYCFLFSKKDTHKYQSQYNVMRKNLFVTGIPRHCPRWINKIMQFFCGNNLFGGQNYALLISRPSNDFFYLSEKQKKQYLKLIKKVVIENNGLCLVIKKHPGEYDDKIFYDILGNDSYGVKWKFSDMHPYYLGKMSEVCITFYSGIAIDMAAIRVNSIELNNLSELESDNNKHIYMIKNGAAVSPYSYYNLTKRITSEDALDHYVRSCINAKGLLNQDNYNNYCAIFEKNERCIENITNIMLKLS